MADVVPPSTALTSVTKLSEKCISTSPSAIQTKNRRKMISTDNKLDVIRRPEKVNKLLTCCNAKLTHSSIKTICDKADRITDSAESVTNASICVARLPQFYWNDSTKNYGLRLS